MAGRQTAAPCIRHRADLFPPTSHPVEWFPAVQELKQLKRRGHGPFFSTLQIGRCADDDYVPILEVKQLTDYLGTSVFLIQVEIH